MRSRPRTTSAREKLLDTASALFYERGIVATGVDSVVAAAGVSKPTLYTHFRSKSELVAAVLERRHTRRLAALPARLAAEAEDPAGRLLAVFDWLAELYPTEAVRGCAFLNAAAETPDADQPAREVIRRQKRWMADYLAELAADAGVADPAELGSQLLLLVDGASGRVLVEAGADPGAERVEASTDPAAERVAQIVGQARRAAEVLIAAATAGPALPRSRSAGQLRESDRGAGPRGAQQ